MDFVKEFQRRVKAIDNNLGLKETKKPCLRASEIVTPCHYNLVIKDMLGHIIKILAYGVTYKECLTLGKHCEKSRLIKESEGQYSLHYTKIERG